MNELKIFTYENNEVRTVELNGETWWVLKDVCIVLGIGNTTDAANRLDDDEKSTFDSIESLRRDTVYINESGLYNVILRSDKPEAKRFKRWITHEVLPSIRKHGIYATTQTIEAMLDDPDTAIRLLTDLKAERQKRIVLEARVTEMRPKGLCCRGRFLTSKYNIKAERAKSVCEQLYAQNYRHHHRERHRGREKKYSLTAKPKSKTAISKKEHFILVYGVFNYSGKSFPKSLKIQRRSNYFTSANLTKQQQRGICHAK